MMQLSQPANKSAGVILEMITRLCNEGYEVRLNGTQAQPVRSVGGSRWAVTVIDENGNDVAVEAAFFLIDAVDQAFTSTPERKEDKER